VDDVITVNGVNVSVTAIEALLRTDVTVSDCAVIALDDPERGSRLIAFICGAEIDADALGTLVTDRLGVAARPRTFTTIEHLPTLPGGKTDRQALIALAMETH
jgi:acyl-coenzyme A synthetase/AMP-(fatty) acid ligase